jgi:hypothetical protein
VSARALADVQRTKVARAMSLSDRAAEKAAAALRSRIFGCL